MLMPGLSGSWLPLDNTEQKVMFVLENKLK